MNCPSDLKLEAHLLDPVSPIAPHVSTCEKCQARLARMEREGDDFRRLVYAQTLDGLTPKKRTRFWLLIPALLPVAAVLLLVRRPPPAEYVGTKGSALKLSVYAGSASGAVLVNDRAEVPAGAALRFKVQASRECNLSIVSVDGDGQVSSLVPSVAVSGAQTLNGGAVLDGRAGPERIYAVCAGAPLSESQVASAVKGSVARGQEGVRSGTSLSGLPEGALQTTLLLEKR
jgi:hypothetical protein